MSPRRILTGLGLVAFALSWFLPAMTECPGWMAFWLSLSILDHSFSPIAILALASPLTNVLMVTVVVNIVLKADVQPRLALSMIIAGTLNAWWLMAAVADQGRLGSGYYLWWLSFIIVGLALLDSKSLSARRLLVGAATLVATVLSCALLIFVVSPAGERAAVERDRHDSPFRDGRKPYDDSTIVALEARIRGAVSGSVPAATLSCRTTSPIPSDCGTDYPEKYETLTLSLPLEVTQPGRYLATVTFDSETNQRQFGDHDRQVRTTQYLMNPGRYRLVWVLSPVYLRGYFIRAPRSEVSYRITRVGTYRELYPGLINLSSPRLNDTTFTTVLDMKRALEDVSVFNLRCYEVGLTCPATSDLRFIVADSSRDPRTPAATPSSH